MTSRIAFRVGTRPEFAFADGDGLTIGSNGNYRRIRIETSGGGARLVETAHLNPSSSEPYTDDADLCLAEGTFDEMSRLYEALRSDLLRGSRHRLDAPSARAALGAAALALGIFIGLACSQEPASSDRVAEAVPDLPSISFRPSSEGPTEPMLPAAAIPTLSDLASKTMILERPAFLRIPEIAPEIPATIPDVAGPPKDEEPSRSSDAAPSTGPTKVAGTANDVPPSEAVSALRIPPAPSLIDPSTNVPGTPAEPTVAASASAATTSTSASAPSTSSSTPSKAESSPIPEDGHAATGITADEQAAITAAAGDIAKGGGAADLLRVLQQIKQLNEGETVTPEVVASLPHEIAQVLKDAGMVAESNDDPADAPDGVPYRIIRLPEATMERFRGKDGIASIPERNTWASTGNFVSIPLPGGGDIRQPDDMRIFGIKP